MVAITQIPKELSTVGVTFGVMNRLDWKVDFLRNCCISFGVAA